MGEEEIQLISRAFDCDKSRRPRHGTAVRMPTREDTSAGKPQCYHAALAPSLTAMLLERLRMRFPGPFYGRFDCYDEGQESQPDAIPNPVAPSARLGR